MENLLIKEHFTIFERYRGAMYLFLQKRLTKKMLGFSLLPFLLYVVVTLLYNAHASYFMGIQVLWLPAFMFSFVFILPLLLAIYYGTLNTAKFRCVILSINESGFKRSGNGFEHTRIWPEFNHWEETKSFVFIYFSKFEGVAHVIPKNNMTQEQLIVLKGILKKHLPLS